MRSRPPLVLGGLVGLVGVAGSGCLQAKPEHCLFGGGDHARGGDDAKICIVATPEAGERRDDDLGFFAAPDGTTRTTLLWSDAPAPAGYVWAPIGLPRRFGEGDEDGMQTVRGALAEVVRARGLSGACIDYDELRVMWDRSELEVFHEDTLDRKTLVGLAAAELPIDGLEALGEAVMAEVERCSGVGTDTDPEPMGDACEPECEDPTPVCGPGGACVQCADNDDEFCDAMGLICSIETGQCVESGCVTNSDCVDPTRPFCDQNVCVPCGNLPDGDAACAELDGSRPVCGTDGGCVLCSDMQLSACEEPTPVCVDGACADCRVDSECPEGFQCSEDNTCLCNDHDDCDESACNMFTGACLPTNAEIASSVIHAGPGQDFERLDDAVASFGPGAEGTIIVHIDMMNLFNSQAVVVDEDRILAFLANEGDLPRWTMTGGGNPHLTVLDGTVLMDGLQLSGNGDDLGIVVDGGRAWIDRSRIVENVGGGILVQNDASLTLRNSFVGSFGDVLGVEINNASAEILYSTITASTFGTTPALGCTSPVAVNIRNSIIVTQGGTPPNELDCDDATIITSAIEADIAMPFDTGWFVDFNGGDYTLTSAGNDVFGGIASWQVGDPPTDINGDPRPTDKGPDDAGADIFP